ncbi:hypothetical protein AFLA_014266 [Aspergillus flavus NRRL3357]|nr:hypothetical protein AFLA_014266 [Aspergillus flavus NRRL3357]
MLSESPKAMRNRRIQVVNSKVCSPVRIGLPVDNATLGPCYVSLAREWDNKSHLSFKSLEALRDTSVHPFLQRLANVDTNYVLILLVEWIFHDEILSIYVLAGPNSYCVAGIDNLDQKDNGPITPKMTRNSLSIGPILA